MATTDTPINRPAAPPKSKATPWIIFVVVLVVAMIAILAVVLISMRPDDRAQANSALQLRLPQAPAYKMPSPPPVHPH